MKSTIWLNGKFVSDAKAQISIRSHALHYGTAVFEGVRFYETARGPAIFRLDEHLKRLFYSASVLGMKIPYSQSVLKKAVVDTVQKSKLRSGYVRPIAFFGESNIGISLKNIPVSVGIIVLPWGKHLSTRDGVKIKTARIRRLNATAFDMRAKIAGAYVNSITAHMEALRAGYDEALMLTDKGDVAEGAGANIFIVKKNKLYTPSVGNILPGITRASIITLAHDMGIRVQKKLSLSEVMNADEVFYTGTAVEVTPIKSVDGKLIGKGTSLVTGKIADAYTAVITGKNKRYSRWLTLCQ